MTDRTPIRYTMTFPFGYNTGSVKKQGIIAKLSTEEIYELGIITMPSPSGNLIKVYDIERTVCDIVKARHRADIQVINQAMKTYYASSKNKDIAKLMNYADRLRVKPKVLKYMEVLVCEQCEKHGRITTAEEVHHIKPLSQGGANNVSNLMSLCTPCHSEITAREGGRWGR